MTTNRSRLVDALDSLEGSGPVYLLHVGQREGPEITLLEGAEGRGWIDLLEFESSMANPEDVVERIERGVRRVGGEAVGACVLVVWRLDELEGAEAKLERLRTLAAKALCGTASLLSFALSEHPIEVSFEEFVGLIGVNVVGVGGYAELERFLRYWCMPDDRGCTLARRVFHKDLGDWVPNLLHDFFDNCKVKGQVEQHSGLAELLEESKVWLGYLRNLFGALDQNVGFEISEVPDLQKLLRQRPLSFIVPPAWAERLVGLGHAETSMRVYETDPRAAELCREWDREATTPVLLWAGDPDLSVLDGAIPRSVRPATVLVGEQAPRTTWSGWHQLLSANVLGGFSEDQLAGSGRARALLDTKPSNWRAFSIRSVEQVFDFIGEGMARVCEALDAETIVSMHHKPAAGLVQLEIARETYLGGFGRQPVTGDPSCSDPSLRS